LGKGRKKTQLKVRRRKAQNKLKAKIKNKILEAKKNQS
jgi:hypothetical protein